MTMCSFSANYCTTREIHCWNAWTQCGEANQCHHHFQAYWRLHRLFGTEKKSSCVQLLTSKLSWHFPTYIAANHGCHALWPATHLHSPHNALAPEWSYWVSAMYITRAWATNWLDKILIIYLCRLSDDWPLQHRKWRTPVTIISQYTEPISRDVEVCHCMGRA